jgi:hypothetical protein
MADSKRKNLNIGDEKGPKFAFSVDGTGQSAHKTWFRGPQCNFNPTLKNLHGVNAVPDHVLAGWVPEAPLITPQTNIVAFGSCFAEHISQWLAKRNFSVINQKGGAWGETYIARFGEGMANSHAVLQQFEWALEGKAFAETLWHDKDAGMQDYNEEVRQQTRAALLASDVFIITLGLSEVWSHKATGDVFWRAVPQDVYDPSLHEFRVSTHAENLKNLREIHRIIRKHKPDAKIIFTLSPIPLVATFRPISCISANAASKAILLAALDEFLRSAQSKDASLFYWPSYEIIMDVFSNRWIADRRHVKPQILDYIMTLFEHVWCTGKPQMGLSHAWVRARCATGDLPRKLYPLLDAGDFEGAMKLMEKRSAENQTLARQAWEEMQDQPAKPDE